MSEQLINEFIDIPAIERQKQIFIAHLADLKKAYEDVSNSRITLQGATNQKEIIAGTQQATAAMQKLGVVAANTNKEHVNLTKAQKQAEIAMRQNAKAASDASNDYKLLSQAYNDAALRYKNYALTLGAAHPITLQAKDDANQLGGQLKKLDSDVGQHTRNVGNYSNAFTAAFQKGFSAIKTVANILPGLGLSGAFLLIYEGIKAGANALGYFNSQLSLTDKITEEAAKSVAKEVAQLTVFKTKLNDLSLTQKERLIVAAEYNKVAAETNKLDLKQIDNLTAINSKIEKQNSLILQRAISTAALSTLTEQAGKFTEAELQVRQQEDSNKKLDQLLKFQSDDKQKIQKNDREKSDATVVQKNAFDLKAAKKHGEDLLKQKKEVRDKEKSELEKQNRFLSSLITPEGLSTDTGKPKAEEKKKEIADMGDFEVEVQNKINKLKQDLSDTALKRQIEYDKAIINDEHKTNFERIDALNRYYDEQKRLVSGAIDEEINAKRRQLARIAELEKRDPSKLSSEQKKEVLSKALINQEIINLESKKQDALIDLVTDKENKYIDILRTGSEEEIRIVSEKHEKTKASIDGQYTEDVKALNKRLTQGKISQEKYNKERAKLDFAYHVASLQAEINYTKKILELQKARGVDVSKELQKLAQLQKQLDDEVKANHIKGEDEKFASTKKTLENIKKIYEGVMGVIGELINASVIKQKNAIQEQITLMDEKTKREIDSANASALSEQDKAAKIQIIQARAAVQKELLARRQREMEEKQARFNKAKAIADIILSTATAIAADIKIPWKIAFDAAIGAAQLAIAIATPIPKYKHGKDEKDPYTGPAIWGDGGMSEMKVSKDGSIEISPSTPTLTYVKPGDIIYPDAQDLMNISHRSVAKNINGVVTEQSYGKQMAATLEKHTQQLASVERAIKNIPQPRMDAGIETIMNVIQRGNNEIKYINDQLNW